MVVDRRAASYTTHNWAVSRIHYFVCTVVSLFIFIHYIKKSLYTLRMRSGFRVCRCFVWRADWRYFPPIGDDCDENISKNNNVNKFCVHFRDAFHAAESSVEYRTLSGSDATWKRAKIQLDFCFYSGKFFLWETPTKLF